MSFWTSIVLYYPLIHPPSLSMRMFGLFAERFSSLGVVNPGTCPGPCAYVPGEGIDLDFAGSDGWEDNSEAYPEGRFCEHPPEVEVFEWGRKYSANERYELLQKHDKPMYRGHLILGDLTQSIYERLYEASEENTHAFVPMGCSITAGPVCIGNEDTVEKVGVSSLLAFMIGGQGYCWPRSHREVVDCALAQPEIQSVADLIREMWPVKPVAPPKRILTQREKLGSFFMGAHPSEPLDWCWGIEGI